MRPPHEVLQYAVLIAYGNRDIECNGRESLTTILQSTPPSFDSSGNKASHLRSLHPG